VTAPPDAYIGVSGNWSDVTRWSLARSPQSIDNNVRLSASGGSTVVTLDTDVPALQRLYVRSAVGSTMTLSQAQHTLTVANEVVVGDSGVGAIVQSGGIHSINGSLYLGVVAGASGSYSISGGSLSVSNRAVVGGGTGNSGGAGVFNHSGGSVTIGTLSIAAAGGASGTYNLDGTGSLTAGTEQLQGQSARAIFNQLGGVNQAVELMVGGYAGAHATYNLSGGVLAVGREQVMSLFNQSGGSHSISESMRQFGTVSLSGGTLSAFSFENYGVFNLTGGTFTGKISNLGVVTLGGSGAVVLNGTVENVNGGIVQFAPNASSITLSSLSLLSGAFDIRNTSLQLSYGTNSSFLSNVRAMIAAGVGGGAGLKSSTVNADPIHQGMGYADGTAGVVSGLPAGQILVRPALLGDVNLDGTVNATDIQQLQNRGQFNHGPTTNGWIDGDFDFDDVVNNVDIRTIALSGNYVSESPAPAAAATGSPPAPASGQVTFNYDPATGDVTVHLNGVANVVDLHLVSSGNKFIPAKSTFTSFATTTRA